ncbi:uncharacterized protein EDB91DRAFT_555570 [Suillus paluster]|uniref:uncharacterized protein n=1 Tax=Suillus paluster TaxID=48578 RepID=UPI001B86F4C2|nr:uncharacterized protein EDB91DRAFT_555570 [Suillus paluster]KAG1735597.1 hypothetical protein EDB91DRAFT_555570 [Suillus paluster]
MATLFQTPTESSTPADFEPDEQWKSRLKLDIENNLRSMVDEAKQNLHDTLKKAPVSAAERERLGDEHLATMKNIRNLAEEQFRIALERERQERRWIAGQTLDQGWSESIIEEQKMILKRIERERKDKDKDKAPRPSSSSSSSFHPIPGASDSRSPERAIRTPHENTEFEHEADYFPTEDDHVPPRDTGKARAGSVSSVVGSYKPPPTLDTTDRAFERPKPSPIIDESDDMPRAPRSATDAQDIRRGSLRRKVSLSTRQIPEFWMPSITPEEDAQMSRTFSMARRGSIASNTSSYRAPSVLNIPFSAEPHDIPTSALDRERDRISLVDQEWSGIDRARDRERTSSYAYAEARTGILSQRMDERYQPPPIPSASSTIAAVYSRSSDSPINTVSVGYSRPSDSPSSTVPIGYTRSTDSSRPHAPPPSASRPIATKKSFTYDDGGFQSSPSPKGWTGPSRSPYETRYENPRYESSRSPQTPEEVPRSWQSSNLRARVSSQDMRYGYISGAGAGAGADGYYPARPVHTHHEVSEGEYDEDLDDDADAEWRDYDERQTRRREEEYDERVMRRREGEYDERRVRQREDSFRRRVEDVARREQELRRREDDAKREEEAKLKEEELRRKEEETKRKEDEIKRKEEEAKRKEEEAKRKEEDARRRQEEAERKEEETQRKEAEIQRKQEEAMKKEEETKRKEDEIKRKEAQAKKKEEEVKKKEAQAKKRAEDLRRQEEEVARRLDEEERRVSLDILRKSQEAKRKEDEVRRKEEDARLKEEAARAKEEEIRRKEEELARREEELLRREAEAIRKSDDKQKVQQEEFRKREEEIRRQRAEEKKRQERWDWESWGYYGPEPSRPTPPPQMSTSQSSSSSTGPWPIPNRNDRSMPGPSPPTDKNSAGSTGTSRSSATWSSSTRPSSTASSQPPSTPKPPTPSAQQNAKTAPGPPLTPMSEAEFHRRQAEQAQQREEQFRREQAKLEQERLLKAGKAWNKQDTIKLFEHHRGQWDKLQMPGMNGVLIWDDFPWPVFKRPSGPDDVTTPGVTAYMLSSLHPVDRSMKDRIKENIRRWHPDRFETQLLPKVKESDRDIVREAAGTVVRTLNDLLRSSTQEFS